MTKKDYEAIAERIRELELRRAPFGLSSKEEYWLGFEEGTNAIIYSLIGIFKEDNPRFDKETFLRACGL